MRINSSLVSRFFVLSGICLCLATACNKPVVSSETTPSAIPVTPQPGEPDADMNGTVCASPLTSTSQIGVRAKFERISLEEGLSDSVVHVIYQDRLGFLWIGTEDGLNRYDGYQFLVYKHDPEDSTSISHSSIKAIYEDARGVLWIGTEDGLNWFDRDRGKFNRLNIRMDDPSDLNHHHITKILEDANGKLWIGTWGGGLFQVNENRNQVVRYAHNLRDDASLGCDRVSDVFEDSEGKLWIGNCSGLDRLDLETGMFTHYIYDPANPASIASSGVRSIAQDSAGYLWLGTAGSGVDRFDPETERFTHYLGDRQDRTSLSDNRVWKVLVDSQGQIWIGTNNGVNQYQPQTDSFISYLYDLNYPDRLESLSNPVVSDIFQDRSGLLWIATAGGGVNVFSAQSNKYFHFQHDPAMSNSASNNVVRGFVQDANGVLWIATDDGLNRYDADQDRFRQYYHDPLNLETSLSNDQVTAIAQAGNGMIWVGTNRGLNQYDPEEDRFSPYAVKFVDRSGVLVDLTQVPITVIWQDSQEQVWLGTRGYGLFKLSSLTNLVPIYVYEDSKTEALSGTTISSIGETSDGSLWIGTLDQGLYHFDPLTGDVKAYRHDAEFSFSLSSDAVLSILVDPSETVWVGTSGGLNRYNSLTDTFSHFREKEGLANDLVYGILQDDQGYLWLSTNQGISRFDPSNAAFDNYNRSDGLQGNEFNLGAAYKGQNGELYFGGINGFNVFCPESIEKNPFIPPVVITKFTQGGAVVTLDSAVEEVDQIALTWPNNYFEFEFAALSYLQPGENRYAYKLDGLEEDWNLVGNNRYGRYTNLAGGTYTLRVIGSNNDGVWNEQGTSVQIKVIPVFWETAWFRWGGLFIMLAAVAAGYRWRVYSVVMRNRQLAMQVEARTHEIEQRRRVAEGLREVLLLLNSNRSLEVTLDYIICQINQLLQVSQTCLFSLVEGARPVMMAGLAFGCKQPDGAAEAEKSPCTYPQHTLDWFAAMVKQPQPSSFHLIDHFQQFLAENPQYWCNQFAGMETFLLTPINVGENVFGGMVVLFADHRQISKEEIHLLNIFAEQAILAVGNAQLRAKAEELAVVSERNRLARELHDAVTQTLFSASLIAEALPTLWQSDQVEGEKLLDELRQLNRGALAEMRTLLMELRPSGVVDARLVDLLQQLTEAVVGRSGIGVQLEVCEVGRLPDDVHIGLYRIAQEALTNVIKHSRADTVGLRLACRVLEESLHGSGKAVEVILEVCDNGCGFDPDRVLPDHFGLVNIRERAQAMNADLDIISRKGEGTVIRITWFGEAMEYE